MAEKEFNKTLDVLLDQIEDIKEKIILKNSVIFVFAQIKKKEDKGSPSKFTKEVEESQDGFEFTKLKSEYFYEARLFHYKDQKTDKTPLITFYHCKLQIKKDLIEIALNEGWDQKVNVLKSYLDHTFRRLNFEGKIYGFFRKELKFIIWNTGLVSDIYIPILCCLIKKNKDDTNMNLQFNDCIFFPSNEIEKKISTISFKIEEEKFMLSDTNFETCDFYKNVIRETLVFYSQANIKTGI
jgi:hypothetical protein